MQTNIPQAMETFTDALRDCVAALGGPKKVGPRMRPELPVEQASQYVRDRLNSERREHFHPEQVLWLLREARSVDFHGAMHYLTDQCSYAAPVPLEPEDERAKLQRQYIEATKAMHQLAERMERINSPGATLRSVQS